MSYWSFKLARRIREIPESVKGDNNFWTYICGLACMSRSFSYLLFPPGGDSLSSKSIETLVPYFWWFAWLLTWGAILIVGAILQRVTVCFIAHVAVTLTYSFFVYSLTFSIILINFDPDYESGDVGWSGVGPLAIVAILNGWRVWKLARDLRTKRH